MVKEHLLPVLKLFFICFIISALLFLILFFYQAFTSKPITCGSDCTSPEISETNNWSLYQNTLLGLQFKYPKDWGDILTSPNNITHPEYLTTDLPNFLETREPIALVFQNHLYPAPTINLFHDLYQGEVPPYAGYYENPNIFLDNFEPLKSTGDICGYHENFSDSQHTHKEIYFSCDPATNTSQSVVERKQSSENGKTYYQYYLRRFLYKKLNNGSYDHLLVSELDHIVQSENSPIINNLSDVYNFIPQADLDQKYDQFKNLVSTIKSIPAQPFSPSKTTRILPSDPNVDTIYQYYSYLEQDQLPSAYNMYQATNTSFSDYQSWYQKVILTDITQIIKQTDGNYRVDVTVQDRNQAPETYRVVMKLSQGKITTLSSVKLLNETIYSSNLSARVESSNQTHRLILTRDSQDFILATCPEFSPQDGEKFASNCSFSQPSFIADGKYLIVNFGAWEYGSKKVYDLQTKKEILEAPYPDYFTYLENKNQFLACHGELFGMASFQYASIFNINKQVDEISISDLIKQDRPTTEMIDFKCNYDQSKNNFIINADFYYGGSTKEYSQQYLYNLDTNQLTVIRQ